jgi:hypothetical protein
MHYRGKLLLYISLLEDAVMDASSSQDYDTFPNEILH